LTKVQNKPKFNVIELKKAYL